MYRCMECPLTGHDCGGVKLPDNSDECVSVIRCGKHLLGQGR